MFVLSPKASSCVLSLALLLNPLISDSSRRAVERHASSPGVPHHYQQATLPEYLWGEAENMRGFSTGKLGEPLLNPSYLELNKDKAPGWGMNGPGVSAEWSQGGESEWNSAAASADETNASIYQDLEVPRAGPYRLWVRYADWANKTESFATRVAQSGRVISEHEFGVKDLIDPHDETSMYWGWAFAWDSVPFELEKGPARISFEIQKPAEARRNIDCFLLTNDLTYKPSGRQKPDFAAMRYMRSFVSSKDALTSVSGELEVDIRKWQRPSVAGKDFLMPWNIAREFWSLYDKPVAQRPLYPFNAEPITDFVEKYKGVADVPIFQSKLVVPVIYINDLSELLKEGSPFLRYVRETKTAFAVLMNYGTAKMTETEGQAAWKLLNGELKSQFIGFISGESIGFVWDHAQTELKISGSMSRSELLAAHHEFYSKAIARNWQELFHTDTGPLWEKLIPAQSTSSTSFAHALAEWGVKLLGMETAAVQPMLGMRIAFTRGAARQFGGDFLYYHAPNFGDTATAFTKAQNLAGPDFFFHTRYGASMGPSLSWYRKSYYLYYMAGASAIYLEQGHDQFFKPGPGEHSFQLNPLGKITDEFIRFAEKHPDRGTPFTPVAFLLNPAHGFEMTDYPQWPFEVSQINQSDRALREMFGVAYFPGLVIEGEPAIADRQPFVDGVFGDIFDVVSASNENISKDVNALANYQAVVIGGRIDWSPQWIERLRKYVSDGGTVVLNSKQTAGLPAAFLGVRLSNILKETDKARCLLAGETSPGLQGQMFRYQQVKLSGASAMIVTDENAPLVTINRVGKGKVIFTALDDLLGEDNRITPFAAHMLAHVFANKTPVEVKGNVEYLINQNAHGWVITLINNTGVYKSQQGLAQVDRNAYQDVELRLRSGNIKRATEWTSDMSIDITAGERVRVKVPPGGVSIIELTLR